MGYWRSLVLRAARKELRRVRAEQIRAENHPTLKQLATDPALPMKAVGLSPDPWQHQLIASPARRIAALCTRRSGKTHATACRVTTRCLTRRSRVLIFAPTEDQSKELLQYVREMTAAVGSPVPLVRESQSELAWANGSRVRVKTDVAKSSRGFTPDLVIIDEAAQVSDELYLSVRPMMSLGKCDMLILSTPFGQLGWFYDIWNMPEKLARWEHFRVTAYEVPRICETDEFKEDESLMPRMWFNQEYLCEFNRAADSVFDPSIVDRACVRDAECEPLDLGA